MLQFVFRHSQSNSEVLTMLYNPRNGRVSVLGPAFNITKRSHRFVNWVCFRPQVKRFGGTNSVESIRQR
jgi:hypothetical protein